MAIDVEHFDVYAISQNLVHVGTYETEDEARVTADKLNKLSRWSETQFCVMTGDGHIELYRVPCDRQHEIAVLNKALSNIFEAFHAWNGKDVEGYIKNMSKLLKNARKGIRAQD